MAYLSEGDKSLAKERLEIFGGGKSVCAGRFYPRHDIRGGREQQINLKAQDKGQRAQVQRVCASVLNGEAAPISLDELATTTRATFRILDSLDLNVWYRWNSKPST